MDTANIRDDAAHLLSLLTGYKEDMTNEEAWDAIPDSLKHAVIVHLPSGHPAPHTHHASVTPTEATPTAAASPAPTAGVPCPACGHTHLDPNYERGCTYGTYMADALLLAIVGDNLRARHQLVAADRALWPLADIQNPDSLRDFIAAAHTRFECHLRQFGVPVTS
ncbi:hypothetical protein [Nocardioides zhouii]|jgi:hypothetical protein|uniref:Uncharacterized protein n=1 Tax=Nocardioides zhouii TaxID=1168729 RepID=A0A4Q2SN88_9ACTN|nr:hypothetical protein [Nocardioides zhouii]RYC05630.1 hypothetical protein EUA94_17945 [Nocardioides zhouii]